LTIQELTDDFLKLFVQSWIRLLNGLEKFVKHNIGFGRKWDVNYKAEKASPSDGALALVSSRIYLATSMATLMPALPISNLIHFRAWATFSSSTTAL
jgi:hypothetical protein